MNESSSIEIQESEMLDYSIFLKSFGVDYTPNSYYWQVGEITQTQGWIIHLSVIKIQVFDLFNLIIPELLESDIPFKIVRDKDTANAIIAGALGYINLAKIVSIYPQTNKKLILLTKKLLSITKKFRGPDIPTDFNLGGIVFTRYGSFNPIMIEGPNNELVKHIYNSDSKLIADSYSIPFTIPPGVEWPFDEIANFNIKKQRKLLNNLYYPITTLKKDVKGNVIKALYFKGFAKIKTCLVKEGKKNMFGDDHGRDIRDRLKWQYDLCKELDKSIPIPKIFDYFFIKEDAYIAMEFIKGITMASWISIAFNNRSWRHLPVKSKLQLINPFINILNIIHKLHEKGIIHRDITPENFIIDKKQDVYLIDMELAWSSKQEIPHPAFRLGTPGFMSPEQLETLSPTISEDIYGIGATLLVILSNLSPYKFSHEDQDLLAQHLIFFTNEPQLSSLAARCLNLNPLKRPTLREIQNILINYKEQLLEVKNSTNRKAWNPENLEKEITSTMDKAVSGLSLPDFRTPENLWLSKIKKEETFIGNEQVEMSIYQGLCTGMAGPLYVLARAKRIGINIKSCGDCFTSNWDYILANYFSGTNSLSPGLYYGSAGIAIAMAEGMNSNLILPNEETIQYLRLCFTTMAETDDLESGASGQGLALLFLSNWLPKEETTELMNAITNKIITSQHKNGYWLTTRNNERVVITGFDKGVSGILWFLLLYIQNNFSNETREILSTILNGLNWLIKTTTKDKDKYLWPLSSKDSNIDEISFTEGSPGIILVFIKAYEIFKDEKYRIIAETNLGNLRAYLVLKDFTLARGLAGLGEIYLEAFRVFKNIEWQTRANWIAGVLVNSIKTSDNGYYWIPDSTNLSTTDLLEGNSGIIHFLLRTQFFDTISHPLSVNYSNFTENKHIVHNTGETENLK